MKNYRNVRSDKLFHNNGKWDTVYTEDDIKRLAYYNVDLPHVVGIGTKRPFSKLSFGNSEGSGSHTTGRIKPGQVTAIAMHEKQANKALDGAATASSIDGQDFVGFSYVENLKNVRDNLANNNASGIAIYSNKSNVEEDTSLKTDKGILYVTDDNFVHIGGVPETFQFIDRQNPAILPGNNEAFNSSDILTGPNILFDVSGSIHVNGFINFLKNGPQVSQYTDNPAGQQTYDNDSKSIVYVNDISKAEITGRAVPEGAIWVGWDKEVNSNGTRSLGLNPRLYIQKNGLNKKILTEDDSDLINSGGSGGSGGSSASGFTFTGDDDSENNNNGINGFFVFRQPNTDSRPGQSLINTYVGRNPAENPLSFVKRQTNTNTNHLPSLLDGSDINANGSGSGQRTNTDKSASAVSVIGNLSVFDFTKGGSRAGYLSGTGDEILHQAKGILTSDIYLKPDGSAPNISTGYEQGELGSIYTDRHIMIGGFTYLDDQNESEKLRSKFSYYTSAIDISGGIAKKPLMRVITGSQQARTLAKTGTNCRDSIIIGDFNTDDISRNNIESIIVGGGDLDNPSNNSVEIKGASRSIIMGTNNRIYDITNSLVVGNDLIVGNNTNNPIDGVVALGVSDGNITVSGDDRFVFATKDGTNAAKKALVIDKNANVTIKGNLDVEGDHVHLEVQRVVAEDNEIELNAKEDGNNPGTIVGTSTMANTTNEGGLSLFITQNSSNAVKLSYDNTNDRWTTAHSSNDVGLAAVGTAGSEKFKVTNGGDLEIFDGTNDVFKVTNDGNLEIGDGTTDVFSVANSTDGNITVAPNGTGKLIINSSGALANNSSREEIQINGGYSSGGASFDISKNSTGTETTNLKISGKLTVAGDIDPTGLILTSVPSAPTRYNNALALFYDGTDLKYTTDAGSTVKTLAVGSSSGGGGGGSTGGTIAFADDLKISGKNRIVYQKDNNNSDVIAHGSSTSTYLKSGSATTAPAFAAIQYSEINGTPSNTSDFTNDSGFITNTANAFNYNNLSNRPTIPSKTSDLTNDSGFITSSSVPSSSDDLTAGTTNLFYTDARVQTALLGTTTAGGTVENITLKENGNNSRTISVGKAETAGESSDLILQGGEAKAGQGGSMNGGNIELRGGLADGNGTQGNVLLTGNNVTLNSTYLAVNTIQSNADNTTANNLTIQTPDVTRNSAADDIYIQGGNNTGTDTSSRGGNVIIEGGPGGINSFEGVIQLNTWVSNKTSRNGITFAPNGTWNAAGASTGGSWGQIWLERAIQSTSTTTGALRVDGGVGIKKNLNVGGNIQVDGNLHFDGSFTVSGTINASNNTVTAVAPVFSGGTLNLGINVVVSNNDNHVVRLPNPSSTSAGGYIQLASSSSNKYEVRVLGNEMKINGTVCTNSSGTATKEVEIATNSFVICICNGSDEWNLFANGIRLTPDAV